MQTLFLPARYNAGTDLRASSGPGVVKWQASPGLMIMHKLLLTALSAMLAMVCSGPAAAERNFPQQAQRGELKGFQYPTMAIGKNLYRLAAGSRIYNEHNLIIMPAALQIQTAPIMYLLDTSGNLSRVWLLTVEEARQHAPPK